MRAFVSAITRLVVGSRCGPWQLCALCAVSKKRPYAHLLPNLPGTFRSSAPLLQVACSGGPYAAVGAVQGSREGVFVNAGIAGGCELSQNCQGAMTDLLSHGGLQSL